MSMITKKRHKRELQENLQILNNIVCGADAGYYPALRGLFVTKEGKTNALYNKLVCLHDYALHFEDDGEKKMEDAGRGWEWFASQGKLVELYGSNKETWGKAINKLSMLGLVGVFNPRMNEDGEKFNSSGQQHSADRAKQGAAIEGIKAAMLDYGYSNEAVEGLKCRPCRWYRIHHYTDKLLKRAENLAPLVKAGAARDKDSIRDALGAKAANAITDTAYNIHPDTDDRRETLEWVMGMWFRIDGYATSKKVIRSAMELDEWKGYTYDRWLETWKAYKPLLFAEKGLKESRPTNAEKAKWGIVGDGWIIRNVE